MRIWLRTLRKQHSMTQRELAEKVGTVKPVVSQWESGTRRPGYVKMRALARVLGPEVMTHFEAEADQAAGEGAA